MAKKKGVCHNYDDCELAEMRAVQEVDEFEFRCTECGKELTPVDGDDGDPNKKEKTQDDSHRIMRCGGSRSCWCRHLVCFAW